MALPAIVGGGAVAYGAQSGKAANLKAQLKNEPIPKYHEQLRGGEGCDNPALTLEIDEASFGDNVAALEDLECQGIQPAVNSFRRYCANSDRPQQRDAAKVGAVKKKIQRIVFRHADGPQRKKLTLQKDGVLLIEMSWGHSDGRISDSDIEKHLYDNV